VSPCRGGIVGYDRHARVVAGSAPDPRGQAQTNAHSCCAKRPICFPCRAVTCNFSDRLATAGVTNWLRGAIESDLPGHQFAVCINGEGGTDEGPPIGGIGVFSRSDVQRCTVEIGYWLAKPMWGAGIMSRVLDAFLPHVWGTLPEVRRRRLLAGCLFRSRPPTLDLTSPPPPTPTRPLSAADPPTGPGCRPSAPRCGASRRWCMISTSAPHAYCSERASSRWVGLGCRRSHAGPSWPVLARPATGSALSTHSAAPVTPQAGSSRSVTCRGARLSAGTCTWHQQLCQQALRVSSSARRRTLCCSPPACPAAPAPCVQEGRLRKAAFKSGAFCDTLVLGLLREDWDAQQQQQQQQQQQR